MGFFGSAWKILDPFVPDEAVRGIGRMARGNFKQGLGDLGRGTIDGMRGLITASTLGFAPATSALSSIPLVGGTLASTGNAGRLSRSAVTRAIGGGEGEQYGSIDAGLYGGDGGGGGSGGMSGLEKAAMVAQILGSTAQAGGAYAEGRARDEERDYEREQRRSTSRNIAPYLARYMRSGPGGSG